MPLLSHSTVQAVRGLAVDAVIGAYLTLKKKAAGYEACCPFHHEKTPSFHVNPKRGTFKCFGCGAGGDGLTFVMRLQKLDFVEAVEETAGKHGIPIQHEQDLTPEQLLAEQERREQRKAASGALEFAAAWYAANTEQPEAADAPTAFAQFVAGRGLSEELVQQARVGYAPAGPRTLLDAANEQGISGPALQAAGLIKMVRKDSHTTYFDVFQQRAMFPVRDWRGAVVGFSGRYIGPPAVPGEYEEPKYKNTADDAWTKGEHLYGLDLAAPHIEKAKCAVLVEGHVDVLQMWEQLILNTVGQQGTALTEEQIKLLRRYTNHVVICYDHDDAGYKALDKNAPLLLEAGFQVSYLIPAKKNAEGRYDRDAKSDPDTFLRLLVQEAQEAPKKKRKKDGEPVQTTPEQRQRVLVETWYKSRRDYIECRAVEEARADAQLGPVETADAIDRVGQLLELIPNNTLRSTYYDVVASHWPAFKKYKLAKRNKDVPTSAVAQEALNKVKGLDVAQLTANHKDGFFQRGHSYWCYVKEQEVLICEFSIEILFFVVSNRLPRYVCKLTNFHNRTRIVVLTTDDFVTVSALDKAVARYNGYVFEGNQAQLNKIKKKLFAGAREAVAVDNYLGWNPNGGFYAWANGLLFEGTFYPCDKYGVVTLRHPVRDAKQIEKLRPESQLEIDGNVLVLNHPGEIFDTLDHAAVDELAAAGKVTELTYHYLPTGATVSVDAHNDEMDDEASKFRHYQIGGLSFADWAALIVKVYGTDNGRTMIAYYVASLFRSTIFKANNGYFPLLYNFGMPGSGKSTSARSLMSMFGTPPQTDGINLESGSTVTGIQRTLSSKRDALVWMNEYKNTLALRTLGMLKGIADGSGKVMGMNTGGNETRSNTPHSAAVFGGQDLPTADSALFKRCILNEFDVKEHDRALMQQLETHEQTGQTTAVTCEVLQYRPVVDGGYRELEPTVTKDLRAVGKKVLGTDPDSRAILNLTSLLTPCRLLMDAGALKFPCTYEQLRDTLVAKLRTSAEIQEVSDEVETYLLTLATLPRTVLEEEFHYKVQKEADGKTKLFLRTKLVHGLYQSAMRQQGGNPLAISTLRAYLEKHRSFLETRTHARFGKEPNPTSAVILDYDLLRKHGVEFKLEQAISAMRPTSDAALQDDERPAPASNGRATPAELHKADQQRLRQKLHDMQTSVAEFIGSRPLEDGQAMFDANELLADFNWDKVPAVKEEDFRAELKLGEVLPSSYGFRTVREEAGHFIIQESEPPF